MAEIRLTVRPSTSWPEAYDVLLPSGRVLAIGRDLSRIIPMRVNEEFPPETATVIVYDTPVPRKRAA